MVDKWIVFVGHSKCGIKIILSFYKHDPNIG